MDWQTSHDCNSRVPVCTHTGKMAESAAAQSYRVFQQRLSSPCAKSPARTPLASYCLKTQLAVTESFRDLFLMIAWLRSPTPGVIPEALEPEEW